LRRQRAPERMVGPRHAPMALTPAQRSIVVARRQQDRRRPHPFSQRSTASKCPTTRATLVRSTPHSTVAPRGVRPIRLIEANGGRGERARRALLHESVQGDGCANCEDDRDATRDDEGPHCDLLGQCLARAGDSGSNGSWVGKEHRFGTPVAEQPPASSIWRCSPKRKALLRGPSRVC
jgi:hypothetical protein